MIEQSFRYCELDLIKPETISKKPICFQLLSFFFNVKVGVSQHSP